MDKITPPEDAARARLQETARDRGASLAALSRLIGRNPAYLQQYVTRRSPRHLDDPDLRLIADYLGVPASGIATRPLAGEGAQDHPDWVAIPRLPLEASAGPGAVAEGVEAGFDKIRFSRRWLREMGLSGGQLATLRVEGDSMEPLLRDGDEILVDHARVRGDGIFLVRVGEALHVKQVQATGRDTIILVSINTQYAPVEIPATDVQVIGRVVWKGGRVG